MPAAGYGGAPVLGQRARAEERRADEACVIAAAERSNVPVAAELLRLHEACAGGKGAAQTRTGISVVVRVRPPAGPASGQPCISAKPWRGSDLGVTTSDGRLCESFRFPVVHGRRSSQEEVYDEVGPSVVGAAMRGCNATVIAYGQTASGKTHTMMGDVPRVARRRRRAAGGGVPPGLAGEWRVQRRGGLRFTVRVDGECGWVSFPRYGAAEAEMVPPGGMPTVAADGAAAPPPPHGFGAEWGALKPHGGALWIRRSGAASAQCGGVTVALDVVDEEGGVGGAQAEARRCPPPVPEFDCGEAVHTFQQQDACIPGAPARLSGAPGPSSAVSASAVACAEAGVEWTAAHRAHAHSVAAVVRQDGRAVLLRFRGDGAELWWGAAALRGVLPADARLPLPADARRVVAQFLAAGDVRAPAAPPPAAPPPPFRSVTGPGGPALQWGGGAGGSDDKEEEEKARAGAGVIPRLCADIFAAAAAMRLAVQASYVEVYREVIYDLLGPQALLLEVPREDEGEEEAQARRARKRREKLPPLVEWGEVPWQGTASFVSGAMRGEQIRISGAFTASADGAVTGSWSCATGFACSIAGSFTPSAAGGPAGRLVWGFDGYKSFSKPGSVVAGAVDAEQLPLVTLRGRNDAGDEVRYVVELALPAAAGGPPAAGRRPAAAGAPRARLPVLRMTEDAATGQRVLADARTVHVSTYEHVAELLEKGNRARATAATKMNDRSSRSHAVFTLHISHVEGHRQRLSQVHMVDLAGSERAAQNAGSATQMHEGVQINRSLLALGRCIHALAQAPAGRDHHVPFRESVLTQLLRDSLGGTAVTRIVATVASDEASAHETVSTLRYAERCLRIMNVHGANERSVPLVILRHALALERCADALPPYGDEDARLRERALRVNDELTRLVWQTSDKQLHRCIADIREHFRRLVLLPPGHRGGARPAASQLIRAYIPGRGGR